LTVKYDGPYFPVADVVLTADDEQIFAHLRFGFLDLKGDVHFILKSNY